jgi:hypothetical protein
LDGDFAAKKVPNAGLLRQVCGEVAASLSLLKTCIKRSDDFNVVSFLGYVEAKTSELDTLDDGELLRRLTAAQARARLALAR